MLNDGVFVINSPAIDGGNVLANAGVIPIPAKCEVVRASVMPVTALAGNLHVSLDSLSVAVQGAEDIGSFELPASTSAFATYFDNVGAGVVLYAGDKVLVQVDNAGDSGENFIVSLVLRYRSETTANDAAKQTETA